MITKSKVQFQLDSFIRRKADNENRIQALTEELPILEARITELTLALETAPEDPVFSL